MHHGSVSTRRKYSIATYVYQYMFVFKYSSYHCTINNDTVTCTYNIYSIWFLDIRISTCICLLAIMKLAMYIAINPK